MNDIPGIILDKSYIQGAPKSSFDEICSEYRVLMPDVLFYEMLSSDEPKRSRCFAKLPQTTNPILVTPHVGALLSIELATHVPAGKPSAHLLDINFRFNPELATGQYQLNTLDSTELNEMKAELNQDIAALIEKVQMIPTIFPALAAGGSADKATAHSGFEKAIIEEKAELATFISRLQLPDTARMPSADVLDENWTVFRWFQVQLLFALDLHARYQQSVLSAPTEGVRRRLEHDVLDAQYLILGALEGGLATKEKKLQRFFRLLCPTGVLIST